MVAYNESNGIGPFLRDSGFSVPLGLDYSVPVAVSRLVDGTLAYTVTYSDPEYPYIARFMVKKNTELDTTERAIRIERPVQKADEAVVLRVSPKTAVEYGIADDSNITLLVQVSRFGSDTLFSLNNGAVIRHRPGNTILHTSNEERAITPGYQWIAAGDRLIKLYINDTTYGLSYAFDDNPHDEVAFIERGEQEYQTILESFFRTYTLPVHLIEQSYQSPYFFIHAVLDVFAQEASTMYFEDLMRDVQKLFVMRTVFSPQIAEIQGSIPEITSVLRAKRKLSSETRPPSRSAITDLVNLFDPSLTVRLALNDEAEEIMRFRGKQNPPGAKK